MNYIRMIHLYKHFDFKKISQADPRHIDHTYCIHGICRIHLFLKIVASSSSHKADMKSYKQRENAAMFFFLSKLYLK